MDISTKEEVDTILRELPFVDQSSIVEHSIKWVDNRKATEINFDCSHPEGEFCGSIIVSKEPSIVRQMFLPVNYSLTLDTLVEKLDPPSCIVYSEHNAESGGCRMEFSYPLLGITAHSGDVKNEKLCIELEEKKVISPNIRIDSFTFSSPNPDYLSEAQCTSKGAITWPGFLEK